MRTSARACRSKRPRSRACVSIESNKQCPFFHSRIFFPLANATTFIASFARSSRDARSARPILRHTAPISRCTPSCPMRGVHHRDPSTSLGAAMVCKAPPPPKDGNGAGSDRVESPCTQNRNPKSKPESAPNTKSGRNSSPKPKPTDPRNPTDPPKPETFTTD
jgi:hypothetical protein